MSQGAEGLSKCISEHNYFTGRFALHPLSATYGVREMEGGGSGSDFHNPGLGQISNWAVKNNATLLLVMYSVSRSRKRWVYLRFEESQGVIQY